MATSNTLDRPRRRAAADLAPADPPAPEPVAAEPAVLEPVAAAPPPPEPWRPFDEGALLGEIENAVRKADDLFARADAFGRADHREPTPENRVALFALRALAGEGDAVRQALSVPRQTIARYTSRGLRAFGLALELALRAVDSRLKRLGSWRAEYADAMLGALPACTPESFRDRTDRLRAMTAVPNLGDSADAIRGELAKMDAATTTATWPELESLGARRVRLEV